MSEQFFTKAQRDFVRNNLRVGSGYIIVKNDDGSTAYTPIYIERESGQVYNPLTGKPLEILLGGNDAEQSVRPTGGILPLFQALSTPEQNLTIEHYPTPPTSG